MGEKRELELYAEVGLNAESWEDAFNQLVTRYVELEGERDEAVRALAFAASVIKSGEPWTETCDREIGRVLYKEGVWCRGTARSQW